MIRPSSILQPAGKTTAHFLSAEIIGRGDATASIAYASGRRDWPDQDAIVTAVKAAIAATDTTTAAAMVRPVVRDFVALARQYSLLGRLTAARRVPLQTRLLLQTGGAIGSWVSEGEPIPVMESAFADGATLPPRKVGAVSVVANELARASDAEDALTRDLAAALGEAIDAAMIDPDNVGSLARPASITHDDPQFASTGATPAAVIADIDQLINSVAASGSTLRDAAFIVSPHTAIRLASLRFADGTLAFPAATATGGTIAGIPILPHTAAVSLGSPTEQFIVLADIGEIVIGDNGEAELSVSGKASIQMSDTPASGASPQISLWAHGLSALRAIRFINWSRRRTGSTATLRGLAI